MASRSGSGARVRKLACVAGLAAAILGGCAGEVVRHGHLFAEVDLDSIRPGMSKDQVQMTLGSPNTTSTVGGDAFYYIASKSQTRPMGRPQVIDRQIVAVYFDDHGSVRDVANYGLQDGQVVNFARGETPSRGKEVTFLEQMFGNIGNRRELARQQSQGGPVVRPNEM